jgi:hypothetical protein
MARKRSAGFEERLERYLEHLAKLLRAIEVVSGAHTLVDSSKLPSFCYVTSLVPGVDARLIHLVRDSRAVAFSFRRKRRAPDVHWRDAYMRQFTPTQSAIDWNALNVAMELIRSRKGSYSFLRYEDLVRDPSAEIGRVLPPIASAIPHVLAGERSGKTHHTVSGNPLRLQSERIVLREDDEWRERMNRKDRGIVTALTFPLLVRYGYVPRATASVGDGKRRSPEPVFA